MDEGLKALVEEHRRLKDQEPKLLAELKSARKEILAAKKLICEIAELISDAVEVSIDKTIEGVDGD